MCEDVTSSYQCSVELGADRSVRGQFFVSVLKPRISALRALILPDFSSHADKSFPAFYLQLFRHIFGALPLTGAQGKLGGFFEFSNPWRWASVLGDGEPVSCFPFTWAGGERSLGSELTH